MKPLFRWWALVALGVVVGILVLIPASLVPKDTLHTLFFPVVVCLLWMLPSNRKKTVPRVLVVGALAVGGGAAFAIRGELPVNPYQTRYYIARFDGDPGDGVGRKVFYLFNQVARSFRLPEIGLVVKESFANPVEWSRRRGVVALLHGERDALRLTFDLSADLSTSGGGGGTREIVRPDLPFRLTVVTGFPSIRVKPRQAEHLGHILPWLLRALDRGETTREERLSLLQFAEKVAASLGEGELQGTARFFFGTESLLAGVEGERLQAEELRCAKHNLARAIHVFEKRGERELAAASYNNGAIARLIGANDQRDFEFASLWLRKASQVEERGVPVRSAMIARENIARLKALGLYIKKTKRRGEARGRNREGADKFRKARG